MRQFLADLFSKRREGQIHKFEMLSPKWNSNDRQAK